MRRCEGEWVGGGELGREKEEKGEGIHGHSAQFGEVLIVDVICLLRDFRVGFAEVSRRMISWREEGARVKRRGRDIVDGGDAVGYVGLRGGFALRWIDSICCDVVYSSFNGAVAYGEV